MKQRRNVNNPVPKNLLSLHPLVLCGLLWCILIAVVLMTRPLLTTIETRAMTVAWEMSVHRDFVVPTLNFKPYTQKPPLLVWLINAGWSLFGVRRIVGTLIAAAFAFGCIVWIYALARRLWPADPDRARRAVWLGFGAGVFPIYGTLIFYDIMLTFFVLGCIYMLVQAARTGWLRYTLGLGLLLGLAGLTKGPVAVAHVLPLALLAPVWHPQASRTGWYGKLALAVAIGLTISLGWAIPAALAGGADYARWIFLQQTTRRIVNAFNHEQSWWFYLAVAPLLLLPWLLLPSLWRRLALLKTLRIDMTLRFLVCWIGPVFVIFCLISGKQLHYLLPLWPALALMLAYLLPPALLKRDVAVAALPFLVFGIVWSVVVILSRQGVLHLPPMWRDMLLPYPALPAAYVVAIGLLWAWGRPSRRPLPAIALMMWLTIVVAHITAAPLAFGRFSTEPVARALRQHPDRPVAVVSVRYQGDVNYLSRLHGPLTILQPNNPAAIAAFFAAHPNGLVLRQVFAADELAPYPILFIQPSRKKRFYALIERATD